MNSSEVPQDETIPKIKRGRPPKLENFDRKNYNKCYYENNKENTKGTYFCTVCCVRCSKSNKSRHNKGALHLSNLNTDKKIEKFLTLPPLSDEFIKEIII